jgi:hypothetical protein
VDRSRVSTDQSLAVLGQYGQAIVAGGLAFYLGKVRDRSRYRSGTRRRRIANCSGAPQPFRHCGGSRVVHGGPCQDDDHARQREGLSQYSRDLCWAQYKSPSGPISETQEW